MPMTSNTLVHIAVVFVIAIGALACAVPLDRCLLGSNNLCTKITTSGPERLGSLRIQGELP